MTDFKECSVRRELLGATASTPDDAARQDGGAAPSASQTLQTTPPLWQRTNDGSSHSRIRAGGAKSISRHKLKVRRSTARSNRRQKIMTAMIPILALALVFLLKNPLKVSSAALGQGASSNVAPAAANDDIEIAWEIPPLYQPGGRDPMRLPDAATTPVEEPVASAVQTRADLIVAGILYSDDKPMAIIDEQLVGEGQQISGATVRKIEKDGIEFEMNGRTWKQAVDK